MILPVDFQIVETLYKRAFLCYGNSVLRGQIRATKPRIADFCAITRPLIYSRDTGASALGKRIKLLIGSENQEG